MDAAKDLLPPAPSPSSSVAVLVVDDDEAIRAALNELLTGEGYDVYLVPDGEPALQRLREHPKGLVVLLDMNMPGMDGAQVLQAVVAEAPLAQRHEFIVLSAHAQYVRLPRTLTALFAHLQVPVIAKPFDIAEIEDAVAQAAQRLTEKRSQAT